MALLDAVNSLLGLLQGGDSLGKRLLSLLLKVRSFLGSHVGLVFLLVSGDLLDLCGGTLLSDLSNQNVGFAFSFPDFHHLDLKFFLQSLDLRLRLSQNLKTLLVSRDLSDDISLFLVQNLLIESDQLQERFRGSVIEPSVLLEETSVSVVNRAMNVCHI